MVRLCHGNEAIAVAETVDLLQAEVCCQCPMVRDVLRSLCLVTQAAMPLAVIAPMLVRSGLSTSGRLVV